MPMWGHTPAGTEVGTGTAPSQSWEGHLQSTETASRHCRPGGTLREAGGRSGGLGLHPIPCDLGLALALLMSPLMSPWEQADQVVRSGETRHLTRKHHGTTVSVGSRSRRAGKPGAHSELDTQAKPGRGDASCGKVGPSKTSEQTSAGTRNSVGKE